MSQAQPARVALAILATLALALSALPATARADQPVFPVMNTSETPPDGVWFRYGPDPAQTTRTTGLGVYMHEHVAVKCYWHGTPFGPYANDVWYYASDVERPTAAGQPNVGWINTHYVDDGMTADHPNPSVPQCAQGSGNGGDAGGQAPAGAGAAPSSPPATANAFYNRSAAVAWALAHARDGQPHAAMCAWFVSHALWAGGFPQDATWTDQGRYHHTAHGTTTEWQVGPLLKYLQSHYSTVLTDITAALRTNAVPAAQPGDVIVYDWGQGDGKSHLSFVVGIASGQYPEVSEMGQYDLNPLLAELELLHPRHSSYTERGWTWSAVHHRWLQNVPGYAHMKAWLLHINGGIFLPSV